MITINNIFKLSRTAEFKSVAIYTFSNFFNKGISFLLLFYFTQVLTEQDFGLLNLFSNSVLLLMPFVSMGVLQSVNTEFYKLDEKRFSSFFSSTLLLPVLVTIISIVLLYLFRQQLHQRYALSTLFILLIPVITFFIFLNEHLVNMVRNNQEPIKYFRLNMGRLLIEIFLAILFISVFNMAWKGRVLAIIISFFCVAAYAIYYFSQRRYLFGKLSLTYIKADIVYSVPIIVMQLSIFAMGSSAGYFIEFFTHDFAQVGVFSVAVTFGSVSLVLCTALLQYVFPKVYELLSHREVNYNAIRRLFLWYIAVMAFGTLILLLAAPIVYHSFLKSTYLPGLNYFYYICMGNFLWSVCYFFYAFMLYYKLKRQILFVSAASLAASFFTYTYCIKHYSSYGAAAGTLLTYIAVLLITLFAVRKNVWAVCFGTSIEKL